MALAVSLTNTGMRNDACEALLRWLRHNPKYKNLLKGKTNLMGSPNSQRRMSYAPNMGRYERYFTPDVVRVEDPVNQSQYGLFAWGSLTKKF